MARRTTVELDEARLRRAGAVLGTSGIKATIHAAFDEVIRADMRRQLADRLHAQRGVDFSEGQLELVRPAR